MVQAIKMMNEVEKRLKEFAPDDKVPCPHPKCIAVKLNCFCQVSWLSSVILRRCAIYYCVHRLYLLFLQSIYCIQSHHFCIPFLCNDGSTTDMSTAVNYTLTLCSTPNAETRTMAWKIESGKLPDLTLLLN